MESHPWHPRVLPFAVYIILLAAVGVCSDRWPQSYPFVYFVQCAATASLLWRYRRLCPELTFRFDWRALPVGVLVAVAWVGLGKWMAGLSGPVEIGGAEEHLFERLSPGFKAVSLGLRFLGMSLLVPIFEELFVRSLLLRSFHRGRQVAVAVIQWCQEIPGLGDWLMHTSLAQRADHYDQPLGRAFNATALGVLSLSGVAGSTLIFMFGHVMRDWPGAILCGIVYCLLLRATRDKGLGPVIWAHGLTNALLWGWCVSTGDWLFL